MVAMVEVKLRQIGNAAGFILPKSIMDGEQLKLGESIFISILKKRKRHEIEKMIGIAKGLPPFVREHGGRD